MTLSEAVETVLELQKRWRARNTPDMDTRSLLIEHTIPELLTDAARTYDFNVEGGAGAGYNNRVPWVRVFSPDFSPTPRDGWYAVFLFAADGSAVFLSLNQGTTDLSLANCCFASNFADFAILFMNAVVRELIIPFVHLIATLARLLGPGEPRIGDLFAPMLGDRQDIGPFCDALRRMVELAGREVARHSNVILI